MTTSQQIAGAFGALVGLATTLALLSSANKTSPQIAFSCVGISTSSNTSLISIVISNQSPSSILYFVGSPVLKSNGVWAAFQYPTGTKLQRLGAGRSVTSVVTGSPASGEARVPALWGFTHTPNTTRWQEIREDVTAYLRMHDFRGRGALYTNYVTGFSL